MSEFRFGDFDAQAKALGKHSEEIAKLNIARAAMTPPLPPIPYDHRRALNLLANRIRRFYLGTSRYAPHQAKRECERRRRQAAKARP